MEKEHNEKCNCEKVQQIGNWDGKTEEGVATGGPRVKCKDCDADFNLTWDQWNAIPDENKTAM